MDNGFGEWNENDTLRYDRLRETNASAVKRERENQMTYQEIRRQLDLGVDFVGIMRGVKRRHQELLERVQHLRRRVVGELLRRI